MGFKSLAQGLSITCNPLRENPLGINPDARNAASD
jgi:hypothetical protein